MSAAKHTPGPWAQHPSYSWIIKQDMRPIADVEDGVIVCNTTAHEASGFFPTPDEGRANARLIAAAPELLEALTAFVDFPADTFEGDEDGAFTMTVRLNDLRAARAAILKAAGEGA